jgi:hypothetical protein
MKGEKVVCSHLNGTIYDQLMEIRKGEIRVILKTNEKFKIRVCNHCHHVEAVGQ